MKVVAKFVENPMVCDGTLVALRHDPDLVVWAGPVELAPLDSFPEGTYVHVHPFLLARIHRAVDQIEPGGIDGDRS